MDPRRAELIERHLPLVEHVVLRVAGSFPAFVDRSELISAGMMGLVEAAARFDLDRGVPFAGYAHQRIKGAVLDVARSADWMPRSMRRLAREAAEATQELANEHGGTPSDEALAERLGVEVSELRRLRSQVELGVARGLDSRQELDRADDADQMVDRNAPEIVEQLEDAELKGYLRAGLDSLPERHRLIVIGLYLEGRSFEELAELLGVTPSRISQLRSDAIDMLRDGIESQFRPRSTERPKGRVQIRQARMASDIARHSDLRARLSARFPEPVVEERMPAATVPDDPSELVGMLDEAM
jgi:RNA polymerase sigma factor for flagellar operon FliA